jgi:rare lipoprotein A
MKIYQTLMLVFIAVTLSACSSYTKKQPSFNEQQDTAPDSQVDWSKVKPVTPKYEPRSKYGNPKSYEQNGRRYTLLASADNHKERGVASWYGTKFHGRRTSSGETYDMFKLTAAHKTLPIPAYAKVTNLENGKQVIVKINDRGPFAKGRIIDLSYAAAHKIGMTQKGTARVEVETITFKNDGSTTSSSSISSVQAPLTNLTPDNSSTGNSRESQTSINTEKQRFIQVGAYSVHETAQKLAKVLDREIRLPVKITAINRFNRKLYRVRIGPIPDQKTAKELLDVLDIKELGKPKIVYQ